MRAMLDELTQIDAIERLSDQRVRPKTRIPILTGLTGGAIAVLGERTKDLLDTLTSNLRGTPTPLFEATALLADANVDLVSLIRREIAEQGESFITSANALFSRSSVKRNRPLAKTGQKLRLGVTVYYFQDAIRNDEEVKDGEIRRQRKNLRRLNRSVSGDRRASILGRKAKA